MDEKESNEKGTIEPDREPKDQMDCEGFEEFVRCPDDTEKKFWSWLNKEYSNKLRSIRHAVRKLIVSCESFPQLAGYTPHGPEHMERVEDIIHRLIPGSAVEELKMIERFYLLASAWVHDVGMLRGLFGDFERDLMRYPDEEIRREHHQRSEKFIVNHFSRLDVDSRDAHALGLISLYHRRSANLNHCPWKFPVNSGNVRLRLLAAYLRLADSLDTDQSRSPSSDYAICIAYNIPVSSKLHWIKSRLVSGIFIEPQEQRVVVYFKEPHASSLPMELRRLNISEKDIPLLKQNLINLRKMVLADLRQELDTVKNTLIRGEITYFLDIEERSTQMVIDDQVFPELLYLADNFELISHPSATRLMYMVLGTMERIFSRYMPKKSDGDKKAPDNSNEKRRADEECVPLQCDQRHKALRRELQDFLAELECQILENRRCHVGLRKLVKDLTKLLRDCPVEKTRERVEKERENIARERRKIRDSARKYFAKYLKIPDSDDERMGNLLKCSTVVNEKNLKSHLLECLKRIERKEDTRKSVEPHSICFNILVYGFSELVIKALCGFRDQIVRLLIEEMSKPESPNVSIHKVDLETIASDIFRLFVCEGQPKTITAPNDALAYHDGSRYATALTRKKFTKVILIPDLAAGNLLQRSCSEHIPRMNLVMLGANGLEFSELDPRRDSLFRHSSGHMAIAALTDFFRQKSEEILSPKLLLVLGKSKCDFLSQEENAERKTEDCCGGEIREKDGYRFWSILKGENVRNEPFLVRDETVRRNLFNDGVFLYNPREDAVPLNMVNDVIMDFGFFENVGENPDQLMKEVKKEMGA